MSPQKATPQKATPKEEAGPVQATMLPERRVRVKQETGRNSRVYYLEFTDGEHSWREALWSVTTLLKVLDKPALEHWAAKATAKAAFEQLEYLPSDLKRYGIDEAIYQLSQARYKQSSNAKAIGTAVHALIDAHITGAERPAIDPALADGVNPRFEQFLRWEDEYQPTYRGAEMTVFNAEDGWAGTLDFIAEIGRRGDGLVDVKNTNIGRDEKPGVYREHALQVAAYANANEIAARRGAWVVPVPMPKVEWGAVLWLYPGRRAFVEVDISEDAYRAFRITAEMYRYQDGPGKRAIFGEQSPAVFGILPTAEEQAAALAAEAAHETPTKGAPVASAAEQDPAAPTTAGPATVVSEQQRRALEAAARDARIGHDGLKAIAAKVCSVDSTKLIPARDFDAVLAAVMGTADPGPESEAAA